ncbi:UNKNOWN [Stylonychia lemnae]|uniref:Cyclic nucleotide-binding domain-containing protein n=1 Tax=Stylonychia lemnae TaxID=5949 RepID=A0A078A0J2_STYLE|nr:UNKNOWN [Stylonychia lemnae]|eukprot:CDW74973.1 UNKNOWN [Stylonychia lemnae]
MSSKTSVIITGAVQHQKQTVEKVKFLKKVIPVMSKTSTVANMRIANITDSYKIMLDDDKIQFGNDKGYLSHSLKTFKLGLITRGEWIGEEVVNNKENTHPFTVIAQSQVTLLEISKEDFFNRMPKEYIQQLKDIFLEKKLFLAQRMHEITEISHQVQGLDEDSGKYEDTQWSILKQVPKASKKIVNYIGNRQLLLGKKVEDLESRLKQSISSFFRQRKQSQQLDPENQSFLDSSNQISSSLMKINVSASQNTSPKNDQRILKQADALGSTMKSKRVGQFSFLNPNDYQHLAPLGSKTEVRENSRSLTAQTPNPKRINSNLPLQFNIESTEVKLKLETGRGTFSHFNQRGLSTDQAHHLKMVMKENNIKELSLGGQDTYHTSQHNKSQSINESRMTFMPFIKKAERQMSQRKAEDEAVDRDYDVLENINKNRKETPNINSLLFSCRRGNQSSYVDRRKTQLTGQKLLKNIEREVFNNNRSVLIGNERLVRLLGDYQDDKTVTSMGSYIRKFDQSRFI